MSDKPVVGIDAETILDRESGGLAHRAFVIADLNSAAYTAAEEFKYDETDVANQVVALAEKMRVLMERVALDVEGQLTFNRECSRCDGRGRSSDEDPCIDCDGKGYRTVGEDDV